MQTTTDNAINSTTQRKPILRVVGEMSNEVIEAALFNMLMRQIERGHDDDQNNKVEAVPVLQATKRN